ncbi:MAG: hypothetical protein HYY04_12740 [Chloroflexi bacterium]|nr:hypothetical protein [Chloroflexota bacterium]
MARPIVHLATTTLVAAVLALLTGRRLPALGALVGGVLVDADHLIDLLLYQRLGPGRWGNRLMLPAHGWELVGPLAWLESRLAPGMRHAIAVGYLVHLLIDQRTNRLQHPLVYSLLYRAWRGFPTTLFGPRPREEPHGWRRPTSWWEWRHWLW